MELPGVDQLLLVVASVGHIALWTDIVNRTHGVGWSKGVVDSWTVACGIGFFAAPIYAWWQGISGLSDAPAPIFWYAMLCFMALLLVIMMRLGVTGYASKDSTVLLTELDRVPLGPQLGASATGSTLLAKIAALPGNQLLTPHFEHRTHQLQGLPQELAGLKIAHLTDLHMSGRIGLSYFEEVIQRVNDWSPDLVCVTGDIVEHPEQIDWIDSTLAKLQSRLGVYFILGNHDRYAGADQVRERLIQAGLIHLGGKTKRLSNLPLTLCGDERPWFQGNPSLTGTEGFLLCLAHTPDRLGWAAENKINFVLAGHCHGGQVCFPLLGPLLCPSQHGTRYAAGSFCRKATAMHVSRGTGSLFPIRMLCPPEVGLITLKCLESESKEGSSN